MGEERFACPEGTYNAKTGSDAEADCISCPADASSASAAAQLSECQCNAGYYDDSNGAMDGECEECTAAPTKTLLPPAFG